MLWFFIFVEFYFVIKYPRFIIITLLSIVTQILIIGYELQVRKLGAQVGPNRSKQVQAINGADLARLQRVTDSPHIQSIYLHHTDLSASREACL